jgi:hypothetical protein
MEDIVNNFTKVIGLICYKGIKVAWKVTTFLPSI